MWLRKPRPSPAQVVRALREQAFGLAAPGVGVAPGPGHPRVWGVLMEMGFPEAVATLVAIADGTVSLYFSNGRGIIDAGQHAEVRAAAERFLALADTLVDELAPAVEYPLPTVGRVRFYARTFDGLRAAEASEVELVEGQHALAPLFHAGHTVIGAVRQTSPPQ